MGRKDSIFNPRASLKLISGFKDWVSCLLQGTTRRMSKGKLVLKDRKSITSVFLSSNGSRSMTGQRLSSFSEYASVSVSRSPTDEDGEPRVQVAGKITNAHLESDGPSGEPKVRAIDRYFKLKEAGSQMTSDLEPGNNSLKAAEESRVRSSGHCSKSKKFNSEMSSDLEHGRNRHYSRSKLNGKASRGYLESNESSIAASHAKVETFNSFDNSKSQLRRKRDRQLVTDLEPESSLQTFKKKSSKKRPAPKPPVTLMESRQGWCIDQKTDHADYQRGTKYVTKTVKSTSLVSHSIPMKKYKKRKAPPPPNILNADESAIYAAVNKRERRNSQKRKGHSNYDNLHFPYVKQKHNSVMLQDMEDEDRQGSANYFRQKTKPAHRQLKRMPNISAFTNSNRVFDRSGSDDSSSSNSISFSPDESEDEKYGLVKYATEKAAESPTAATSSNYLQYSGENSDVCLKISIQKTETNVVTVEEVPQPRTVHYTIEEDTSSSSELSDEPPIVPVKLKAISAPPPEPQQEPSNDSEDSKKDSKTIFDELNLKPPAKGTVKEFVQAFNMLAIKGNDSGSPPKNIQSFPTKWEFQNNNKAFPNNQFLLPIAEESLNETSEQDGNASLEESTSSNGRKRDDKEDDHRSGRKVFEVTKTSKQNHASTNQKPSTNQTDPVPTNHKNKSDKSSDEKCSHCSERHSTRSHSKCQRKRTAPKLEKLLKDRTSSSPAHVAALSSLLQENTVKGIPSGSSKLDLKMDQPIMVGLYIEDKSSHKGPMPLLITPSMSLKKLKKQVEKEYNLPRHQQCWILGQSFAVQDEASLASYGVKEAGCPVLLYIMSKEQRSSSLPCRGVPSRSRAPHSDSSDEEKSPLKHRSHKVKGGSLARKMEQRSRGKGEDQFATTSSAIAPKYKEASRTKSEHHRAWEEDYEKKTDYRNLVALDDVDLVPNTEAFDCPVCFLQVEQAEGAVLQECLHSFCKECLASSIQYSDTAIIKCPFANEEYSCESHLQEREIKCLVTPDIYERHLARSMALAESQAQDSFHCKTPDCPGWCLYEDNANTFLCPVCKRTNCLTCAAVHEGRNCRQYQDSLAFNSDTSEEARKTREYLKEMVLNGEAMECPKCQVILMKKWGCDWLKCSMCHTEVCWVTKGPRWGPGGRGDTSGGCKCMLDGVRCHPKCSYCH